MPVGVVRRSRWRSEGRQETRLTVLRRDRERVGQRRHEDLLDGSGPSGRAKLRRLPVEALNADAHERGEEGVEVAEMTMQYAFGDARLGGDCSAGQRVRTAIDGLRQSGGFGDPEVWTFEWQRRYSREQWLDELPTTGLLTSLPAARLAELLSGVMGSDRPGTGSARGKDAVVERDGHGGHSSRRRARRQRVVWLWPVLAVQRHGRCGRTSAQCGGQSGRGGESQAPQGDGGDGCRGASMLEGEADGQRPQPAQAHGDGRRDGGDSALEMVGRRRHAGTRDERVADRRHKLGRRDQQADDECASRDQQQEHADEQQPLPACDHRSRAEAASGGRRGECSEHSADAHDREHRADRS
jgi:hypothetical protein